MGSPRSNIFAPCLLQFPHEDDDGDLEENEEVENFDGYEPG
jgi:hypothetical protein